MQNSSGDNPPATTASDTPATVDNAVSPERVEVVFAREASAAPLSCADGAAPPQTTEGSNTAASLAPPETNVTTGATSAAPRDPNPTSEAVGVAATAPPTQVPPVILPLGSGEPIMGIPIFGIEASDQQLAENQGVVVIGSSDFIRDMALQSVMVAAECDPVFRCGRVVRFVSIVDFILVILLVLSYWLTLFLLPLPIIGFIGAAKYHRNMVMIYFAFFPIIIGVRIVVTVLSVRDSHSTTAKALFIVLGVVGVLAEAYVARLVWLFLKMLRKASAETIELLREGWVPHL